MVATSGDRVRTFKLMVNHTLSAVVEHRYNVPRVSFCSMLCASYCVSFSFDEDRKTCVTSLSPTVGLDSVNITQQTNHVQVYQLRKFIIVIVAIVSIVE